MDLLLKNLTVLTMDDEHPLFRDAYIAVENGKLAHIGSERPKGQAVREIDCRDKLAMPGLINAHAHLPMTLFRGYADGVGLQTWLNDYIFPAEDRLDSRAVRAGADIALAECLMTGTTSVSDMYFFSDDIARAVGDSGMKGNIARSLSWFGGEVDMDSDVKIREMKSLVRDWNGFDGGRIVTDVSIHGEYTSNHHLWTALADFAGENGLGMQVHLSETKREHEECLERHGRTPAKLFEDYGVWNTRACAAHCVWVTREDMEILSRRGVTAVYNPVSNMKLASGVCPVPELLEKGVNLALGTDGVSSNNSHDMFEEIKTGVLLQRVCRLDPGAVGKDTLLRAATAGGARAQGRENECGVLKAGMDADMILIDMAAPNMIPCTDPAANVAFSACGMNVTMTMVRGRILYENGEFLTIDVEKARWEAEHYALKRIFNK